MVTRFPTGPAKSQKVLKNEKLKFSPVEVLKLAIRPVKVLKTEKVLIFGQCGPKKLIWPAR